MEVKKTFNVGDKVKVKITSITSFGAFCDLLEGGSGLIHISEIDNKYIKNISDYLKVGSIMDVMVTKVLDKPFTYALSLKRVSKRKRQTLIAKKKPLTRKEQNKEFLDSFSYDPLLNILNSSIDEEYSRLILRR